MRSLVSWAYSRIVSEVEQQSVLPVWILLPIQPGVEAPEHQTLKLTALARETGFVVVDLSAVYDGVDPSSIVVAEWDHHSNARGHLLIADGLLRALKELGETTQFPSISQSGSGEMQ